MSFIGFLRDVASISRQLYDGQGQRQKTPGRRYRHQLYRICLPADAGYDFYWLYSIRTASSRWRQRPMGNITTGTELIRASRGEAFALPVPCSPRPTAASLANRKGNVWLDPSALPLPVLPVLAQCRRCRCEKWIKIFTFLPKDEIAALYRHMPQPRRTQPAKNAGKGNHHFCACADEHNKAVETTEKYLPIKRPAESLASRPGKYGGRSQIRLPCEKLSAA